MFTYYFVVMRHPVFVGRDVQHVFVVISITTHRVVEQIVFKKSLITNRIFAGSSTIWSAVWDVNPTTLIFPPT